MDHFVPKGQKGTVAHLWLHTGDNQMTFRVDDTVLFSWSHMSTIQ